MFIETGTGSHPHLALHVLCDDDEGPLRLHHLLKHWQDGRKPAAAASSKATHQQQYVSLLQFEQLPMQDR
jgi:hypothetical protein